VSEKKELLTEEQRLGLLLRRYDWLAESKEQLEDAVDYRRELISSWTKEDHAGASLALRETYRALREFVARFFPKPFWQSLDMESGIEGVHSIEERYKRALTYGYGSVQRRGRHESLKVTDIAVDMMVEERRYPYAEKNADLNAMMDLVVERLFDKRSEDLTVDSLHDDRVHHVVELAIDKELVPSIAQMHMRTEYPCRIFARGGMRAFTDKRVKDPFRVFLKQWSRHAKGKNPFDLTDHLGFRFVCPDIEEAEAVGESLQDFLENIEGVVESVENNLRGGGPADATNLFSSPDHRMIKIVARWKGKRYEFQIMTFEGHLTSQYASDTANHLLYELMCSLPKDGAIVWLFPASITGVNTLTRDVQRKMYRYACRQGEWDD